MDDLCIKMIANSKKLKTEKPDNPLSGCKGKLFQILETKYITHPAIQDHMTEFSRFMDDYNPTIIAMFQKSVHGKQS